MSDEFVQYIIFGPDFDAMVAPVKPDDGAYFLNAILPTLRPLSDEEYMFGFALIPHTAARYSYLLHKNSVFWCSEWDPGLLVVRFSPDGAMAATALRSPTPNFGGREPTEADLRDYDEDAPDHQYNLVFNAWDALFDDEYRKWQGFKSADEQTVKIYDDAIAHVGKIEQRLSALEAEGKLAGWSEDCKRNIAKWAGDGIRVR
ncbi:MAG TPA: hypothetical protein VKX17_23765 [Planctomycetota bacterium]|nr:hypothetical protein [Planctomycetota bacterium]